MQLDPRERGIVTAILVLLLAWLAIAVASELLHLLERIADVLLIFLVAWAVSYLLLPAVDLVDRRTRLGRTGAVAIAYVAIAVVLAIVLVLGVPAIAGQLAALTDRGPEFGERAAGVVAGLQERLATAGLRVDVTDLYGALFGRFGELTGIFASNALAVLTATGTLLFDLTLVLIIAFFMLVDGERLWSRFTGALGEELRSEAELFRRTVDRSFGGFLRASLLLGVVYGVAQFLILAVLAVPFAGVLAIVAGLVVVVPFFGPIVAIVPVLAVAAFGAPDRFLAVLLATMILQQIVLNVVGPRIMADVVGIHPLLVFFAILVGARLAGFWGVVLAVPVAGIVNSLAVYAYEVARGRRARTDAHLGQ